MLAEADAESRCEGSINEITRSRASGAAARRREGEEVSSDSFTCQPQTADSAKAIGLLAKGSAGDVNSNYNCFRRIRAPKRAPNAIAPRRSDRKTFVIRDVGCAPGALTRRPSHVGMQSNTARLPFIWSINRFH